jgi:hypothetical protein
MSSRCNTWRTHARTHHFEYVPGQLNAIDRTARRIRLAPLEAAGELSHALLYPRHQLSLHGPGRAALLWLAERINAVVQPDIRIS